MLFQGYERTPWNIKNNNIDPFKRIIVIKNYSSFVSAILGSLAFVICS